MVLSTGRGRGTNLGRVWIKDQDEGAGWFRRKSKAGKWGKKEKKVIEKYMNDKSGGKCKGQIWRGEIT